ncbi:MAG: HD-GYP domain-containing protein [Actinomycetota bacterium]|nr:HD-GYP domain-containing protein [Actinomycetota bacterium]
MTYRFDPASLAEGASPQTSADQLPQISVEMDAERLAELERTKSQLLVFAREISGVYQRERKQAARLNQLMDELRDDYLAIIQTLALTVEAKDEYTRYHLERCREYGMALASAIDPGLATAELQYGFLLHDVGKIGVPESILTKAGPLTLEEMRVMRTHPLIGVQIVSPMRRILNDTTIDVIRYHHERFDGEGYPDRLKGEDIPLGARIFSVVDAFDAMTTDRPYRQALSFEEAVTRLQAGAGTQFDPNVVRSFADLMDSVPGSRTP